MKMGKIIIYKRKNLFLNEGKLFHKLEKFGGYGTL